MFYYKATAGCGMRSFVGVSVHTCGDGYPTTRQAERGAQATKCPEARMLQAGRRAANVPEGREPAYR